MDQDDGSSLEPVRLPPTSLKQKLLSRLIESVFITAAIILLLPLLAKTPLINFLSFAQSANPFSSLSSTLRLDRAEYSFTYTGVSTSYTVDMSTFADFSWGVFWTFAVGSASPVIETNPTKWDAYTCGTTLYWRVKTPNGDQSDIQTGVVDCTPTPSPTPTLTIETTPTPTPTPPQTCQGDTVWDGSQCRTVTISGDTAIVGGDQPVASRSQLDEIERSFVRKSFANFPEELFAPDSRNKADQIQQIRLESFPQKPDGTKERAWEFIINASLKSQLDSKSSTLGGDTITILKKHAEAASAIWSTANPSIHRMAIAKRIIIVSDSVLSGNNWQVTNDTNFGWWANDQLNGAKGFIPYDIDSRWALSETWMPLVEGGIAYQGVKIDYGLIHELTHHLPVGDNYVYGMGNGHGIIIPQPNGKSVTFPWNAVSFMYNDHMSGSAATNLTAPSSHYINFYWQKNPTLTRASQFLFSETTPVYAQFFHDPLTIQVTNLGPIGVEDCTYLRQGTVPIDPAIPVTLETSTEYQSRTYTGGSCTLVLSASHQRNAFPGAFIGLVKNGTVFPLFIPRNLMETLLWANAPSTLTIEPTNLLAPALTYYINTVQAGSGNITMSTSSLWNYMDLVSTNNLSSATIASASIDALGNRYLLEYRFPTPTPSPIPTPTPIPNLVPVITTSTLPPGIAGMGYSATVDGYDLNVTNELTLTLTGLPAGLTQGTCTIQRTDIVKISCIIAGKPKKAGTFSVKAKLTDSKGASVTKTFTLTIAKSTQRGFGALLGL